MDIAITQKKLPATNKYVFTLLLILPVIYFAGKYILFLGHADFSVDRDAMTFAEVQQGKFTVSVRGSGVLVPNNIQWLSSNVEARVEKSALKAGNIVKTGDVIVELSNPQLVQQLAESHWELEAMNAEFSATKVEQESALLQKKSNVLDLKLNYERSLLEENMQTELLEHSAGAVSQLEYRRTKLETSQFKQRWKISQKQHLKMQESINAQETARRSRLNKAEKILERIQQRVDELHVRATMNSIVLEMPLEVGQRVVIGSKIAKLAQQDNLFAELQVPELQIRDVAVGQRVVVDTRNNIIFGVVSRVDPAVVKGTVQVDVVLDGSLPDDARPDLSVDGEIKIAEIDNTLFVARPLFAQSRSQSSFYRLTANGHFAERVEVLSGYGSVNQIQVVEGLELGDKIVTSDSTRLEKYEIVRIN